MNSDPKMLRINTFLVVKVNCVYIPDSWTKYFKEWRHMQQVSDGGASILHPIRIMNNWFRWPHGSPGARLLGLRVRIPPGHCCLSFVHVVSYQVELFAKGRSLVQRSPTVCVCVCVCVCVIRYNNLTRTKSRQKRQDLRKRKKNPSRIQYRVRRLLTIN